MSRKAFFAASAAALCLSVPAVVWAVYQENAKALYCGDPANPVCGLYQVCRPILDQYPEAEISEKGKDCTLTIESRQIVIRRKRTGEAVGYFFYAREVPRVKKVS